MNRTRTLKQLYTLDYIYNWLNLHHHMYTPGIPPIYCICNKRFHSNTYLLHKWVIYTSPTFEYNYPCTNFCAQLCICMYSFAHIYFNFTDPMCSWETVYVRRCETKHTASSVLTRNEAAAKGNACMNVDRSIFMYT